MLLGALQPAGHVAVVRAAREGVAVRGVGDLVGVCSLHDELAIGAYHRFDTNFVGKTYLWPGADISGTLVAGEDMAVVADQIEKLGSAPPPSQQAPSSASGYPHTIAKGDTLSAIATAYQRELGIRVTVDDILAANPGLDPKKLKIGDVIIIPDR